MSEQQAERVSYVTAWEDDATAHPVVAELKAHPGRWAQVDMDTYMATRGHPQVQHRSGYDSGVPRAIRWIPDPVMAAIVTLKEAGYKS